MDKLRRVPICAKSMLVLVLTTNLIENVFCANLAQNSDDSTYTPHIPDKRTWTISKNDNQIQLYADLINIFKNLNVITVNANSSACVTLQEIVRETKDYDPNDESRTIGVYLYFKEVPLQKDTPAQNNQRQTNNQRNDCSTSSGFPLFSGLNSMSMRQANSNETSGNNNNSGENGTGVLATQSADNGYKKDKGLSRTQVVVIATCSAVIGTFFIIAGALRISSCVKRYRTNREQALNLARRASSMGIIGSNLSSGNLRRDSSSSKASRQSNATFKSGSGLQVTRHEIAPPFLSHNSPPLHNTEHKPLLPVNSTMHASEGGSSHGSIAYIDEESQSRTAKDNNIHNGSETESEDDPLLRKSPDSGSSIDVVMADVYNVENESMTSYKGIIELPDDELKVKECVMNGLENNHNGANDTCASSEMVDSKSNTECVEGSDVEMCSENDIGQCSSEGISLHSNGIDNDKLSENNVDDSINTDDNDNSENNISDTFAVTVGLNQSDNSISNNPSYAYGNQTEYSGTGGYGYIAYIHPYENNYNDLKFNSFGRDFSNIVVTKPWNTSFDDQAFLCGNSINAENCANQNNNISPGGISSGSQSNSYDNSGEPLLPNNDHSRTPSSGNIVFTAGADNLALLDSGDDDPGNTQNIVVSHIVPLAEYHKRSLSIDELEMQ